MQTLPDIPHDYGTAGQVAFAIDKASFGDGYSQRRPKGLNSVADTLTLNWTLLEPEDWQTLYDFLRGTQGVTAFLYQPAWEPQPRQWLCSALNYVKPTSYRRGSITAQLEENFDP